MMTQSRGIQIDRGKETRRPGSKNEQSKEQTGFKVVTRQKQRRDEHINAEKS